MIDTWQAEAHRLVGEIVKQVGMADLKTLRKALRDGYPWGERRYWPYKCWCRAQRVAIEAFHAGAQSYDDYLNVLHAASNPPRRARTASEPEVIAPIPGQLELF